MPICSGYIVCECRFRERNPWQVLAKIPRSFQRTNKPKTCLGCHPIAVVSIRLSQTWNLSSPQGLGGRVILSPACAVFEFCLGTLAGLAQNRSSPKAKPPLSGRGLEELQILSYTCSFLIMAWPVIFHSETVPSLAAEQSQPWPQ